MGPQKRSGRRREQENPARTGARTLTPRADRYTDWVIPAPAAVRADIKCAFEAENL
jgi:hypothetical protein